MKFLVFGMGYVGLANALLLAQKYEVIGIDTNIKKIKMLQKGISPLQDKEIQKFLSNKNINIKFLTNYKDELNDVDYIIIATPTNFDEESKTFDTTSIEQVMQVYKNMNIKIPIIIRSTIPFNYINLLKKKYAIENIIYLPEFLREGKALLDNLNPSRFVIGIDLNNNTLVNYGKEIERIYIKVANNKNFFTLYCEYNEAIMIKLYANTYLAMRVAFFNEVDNFCLKKHLNCKKIIKGICADQRIGDYYNNPSFGYGGYCLPKDTKQTQYTYHHIKSPLIKNISKSNDNRKEQVINYIIKYIRRKNIKKVGIYRLSMKNQSDNFRNSAILDIIQYLKTCKDVNIEIYEPLISDKFLNGCKIQKNFDKFKNHNGIIIANRYDDDIKLLKNKVFTRDIFMRD